MGAAKQSLLLVEFLGYGFYVGAVLLTHPPTLVESDGTIPSLAPGQLAAGFPLTNLAVATALLVVVVILTAWLVP